MDVCAVCGSQQFEEIDGLFYCVICQSQRVGVTLEEFDDTAAYVGLIEVRKGRSKKVVDTGIAWTTTEAFNYILITICTDLTAKLDLPPDFKRIVLALWATYLAQSEVAFVENNDAPKLHLGSTKRDIQLLHQGLQKVSQPKYKKYSPRVQAATADLSLNRTFYWIKIKQNQSQDLNFDHLPSPTENLDGSDTLSLSTIPETIPSENVDGDEPKEAQKSKDIEMADVDSLHQVQNRVGANENNDYLKDQQFMLVDEGSENISFDVYDKELRGPPAKKSRSSLRPQSQRIRKALQCIDEYSDNEDENVPISLSNEINMKETGNPDHQQVHPSLSKRSRIIKKLAKEEHLKPLLKHISDISVDKITMSKALSLIVLAFRIMNLNYHICDIIQWIKLGHIPFFDPIRCLPKDWVILPGEDSVRLHPRELPCAKNLSLNVALIKTFLQINTLPLPDMHLIIRKFLLDLNLPQSLANYVINLGLLSHKSVHSKLCTSKETKTLPSYETEAYAILVVALRKLFLTGVGLKLMTSNKVKSIKNNCNYIEKVISNHVSQEYENAFVWNDWLDHTMVSWKLVKRYFLPINREFEKDISDCDIMLDYYKSVSSAWLGTDNILSSRKHHAMTKEFHENLARMMDDFAGSRKNSFLPDSVASIYHFKEAKNFVKKRLDALGFDTSVLVKNFQDKSVDYLNKLKVNTENLAILKYQEKWHNSAERWPMSINLLIEIGSFLLSRSRCEITAKIYRYDAIVFSKSFSAKSKSHCRRGSSIREIPK